MKSRLNLDELNTISLLSAEGLTPNAIGIRIGRDPKTVSKALRRQDVAAQVQKVRGELADRYEELNHRMLDSIGDEDIHKINAYQRVVACGILTDKTRLLRGYSTDNYLVLHSEAVREACKVWGDGHIIGNQTENET